MSDGDKIAITLIALEIMREGKTSGRADAQEFMLSAVDPGWDASNGQQIVSRWRHAVAQASYLISKQ